MDTLHTVATAAQLETKKMQFGAIPRRPSMQKDRSYFACACAIGVPRSGGRVGGHGGPQPAGRCAFSTLRRRHIHTNMRSH